MFCDFAFSGKPKGVCIEVAEEGRGRYIGEGCVRVRLTESVQAYSKGEVLELTACEAVPRAQEVKIGGIFRRVNTEYQWVKPTPQVTTAKSQS
jgi:hypothetical protein